MMHLSHRDLTMFSRAALVAVSGENRVRVGAVVTKGRNTLSDGYNRYRNQNSNVPYGEATVHAERAALARVGHHLNCTLYVARIGLNGSLMPSLPCDDCMGYIVNETAVSKIVYLNQFGDITKVRL